MNCVCLFFFFIIYVPHRVRYLPVPVKWKWNKRAKTTYNGTKKKSENKFCISDTSKFFFSVPQCGVQKNSMRNRNHNGVPNWKVRSGYGIYTAFNTQYEQDCPLPKIIKLGAQTFCFFTFCFVSTKLSVWGSNYCVPYGTLCTKQNLER
jgi:hypothetical protein